MGTSESNPRPLAGSAEVAEFLGVPVATLDQWAYRGVGPRFSKVGRHRRYRWSDVEEYVEANASEPRSA
ncbi:MAG: DNA-binding protein [Actinomycetia bacterium]|nr:DNA-binding protein [Actinomycetes bacterium]